MQHQQKMAETREIEFEGKKIILTRVSDFEWVDATGMHYFTTKWDPGRGGVGKFLTPRWDPYRRRTYRPHDVAFGKEQLGMPNEGNVQTFTTFVKDATIDALIGVYAVVGYPLVVTLGGIGGLIRWATMPKKK